MQELTKKRERLIAKTALKKRENDLIEQELSGLEVTVAERAHIHEAIGSMNTLVLRRQEKKITGKPSASELPLEVWMLWRPQ